MNTSKSILNIYIELDCIVDTRLSLLYNIDEEMLKTKIVDGSYHERINDEFDYITTDVFSKVYKYRDNNVLRNPSPTGVIPLLAEYVLEASQSDLKEGGDGEVIVYLNTYPYILSDAEVTLIKDGLRHNLKKDVEIIAISLSNSEVTPKWISSNIAMMVKYDGLDWLEYHTTTEDLFKYPLANVAMIVPALISDRMIIEKKNLDIFFKDMETSVQLLIKLIFMPVKHFSINILVKK